MTGLPETRAVRQRWTFGDPGFDAVVALGFTQIIAWGTTLYVLGALGRQIAQDTGWGEAVVYGGLTIGLLVSALLSPALGRAIDRHGGRAIMSIGSVLVAAGLALLALTRTPAEYWAAWALLGVAMRMTLYDAAFPALVQVTPSRGRRAISYLTLFGGLASTIFWPIAFWLDARFGWRATLAAFAALNLAVCLPLHWFGLGRREVEPVVAAAATGPAAPSAADAAPARPLTGPARTMALGLFSLVLAFAAFIFGALAVHLVRMIEASGVPLELAVGLASLKGVAQVGGRLAEIVFGQRLSAITLGRIAIAVLPLSFAVLMAGGANFATALAFTLLFGITNGLTTIVRGAVPLALFGREGYGAVLGLLATPYLVLNALAPAAFALIIERAGYAGGTVVLLAAALAALAAMEGLALWYRRR